MIIYESIVKELIEANKTIATMESCTGGALASEITSHPGASVTLRFSAVTYSNEYKIKMGVDENIIDKYSVYSKETAESMAKNISLFAASDYGIGVTGKINTPDPANLRGSNSEIFVCIYDSEQDKTYEIKIDALPNVERNINKEYIVNVIGSHLLHLLNIKKEQNDVVKLQLSSK